MTNIRSQYPRSITLTSGNIRDLAKECEQLNIRGTVALHQDVHIKRISTHGYSSFHYQVTADTLNNTGSCVIKGNCEVKEIINKGNFKIRSGQTTKINSLGKLTIEQILQSDHVHSIGVIQAKEIHSKNFQLKVSSKSEIERLITIDACVKKDMKTISLFQKKLICKYIKGEHLQLSYTDAEVVEGDIVVINKNCNIQTLYYKEKYIISPLAKVQHIIRREK
ncbi:hypothetical protein [Oceanobacillus picturae]|uniref:hypothetical protein n=1 Tax=Oceanobacillus picturae TaxID=171693 RepID=UPI00363B189E